MLSITIQSNVESARLSWLKARRDLTYAARDFLKQEKPRILKHVQEIVKTTVYEVYRPKYYMRTYDLYRSMRAEVQTDPHEMLIDSDPEIAQAKTVEGGYAKFVAGEGPGIGFLRPFYGVGENLRPSYFPRRFHEHIVMMGSSIYSNLEVDLTKRLADKVDRILRKGTWGYQVIPGV